MIQGLQYQRGIVYRNRRLRFLALFVKSENSSRTNPYTTAPNANTLKIRPTTQKLGVVLPI